MKATPHSETEIGGAVVIRDPDAGRIQIKYPAKPDSSTIARLKHCGFRWTPSLGVWQRHLNAAGEDAVRRVLTA